MELWIRSQDKRLLMKIETISLEHNDNYARIRGYGKNDDFILGIYKSKERALEVLDEIQKYIVPNVLLLNEKIGGKQVCQVGNILSIVYKMPEE